MTHAAARPQVPDLPQILRHMLAVLQEERRAIAGLDLDGIVACAEVKGELCEVLAHADAGAIDPQTRELIVNAERLNLGNARLRNLVAGKVATQLAALTGRSPLYRVGAGRGPALAARR